jgi:hypothetical protein
MPLGGLVQALGLTKAITHDMPYECISSLEEYLTQVEAILLSKGKRVAVNFPLASVSPWDGDMLAEANEALLAQVSRSANLYAIFTAACGVKGHSLRYLGKTTRKLARQRIRNHLFRKHEKTGSKLARVISHVCDGGTVEIAWVSVWPESLRNYLEEELILRHPEADWNKENRERIEAELLGVQSLASET